MPGFSTTPAAQPRSLICTPYHCAGLASSAPQPQRRFVGALCQATQLRTEHTKRVFLLLKRRWGQMKVETTRRELGRLELGGCYATDAGIAVAFGGLRGR